MYVLCSGKPNGVIILTGPFPSEKRALEYAVAMDKSEPDVKYRHHTKLLIIPYSVVKNVVWR